MINEEGEQIVECRICGRQTYMTETELCDRCWKLKTSIERDPNLAIKILNNLEIKKKKIKVLKPKKNEDVLKLLSSVDKNEIYVCKYPDDSSGYPYHIEKAGVRKMAKVIREPDAIVIAGVLS